MEKALKRVNLIIDDELYRTIRKRAHREKKSISRIVRELLRYSIAEKKKKEESTAKRIIERTRSMKKLSTDSSDIIREWRDMSC